MAISSQNAVPLPWRLMSETKGEYGTRWIHSRSTLIPVSSLSLFASANILSSRLCLSFFTHFVSSIVENSEHFHTF